MALLKGSRKILYNTFRNRRQISFALNGFRMSVLEQHARTNTNKP